MKWSFRETNIYTRNCPRLCNYPNPEHGKHIIIKHQARYYICTFFPWYRKVCAVNALLWVNRVLHTEQTCRLTPVWSARWSWYCDRIAYPFPHVSHLYLQKLSCLCATCSLRPPVVENESGHLGHGKGLSQCLIPPFLLIPLFPLNGVPEAAHTCRTRSCVCRLPWRFVSATGVPQLPLGPDVKRTAPPPETTWQRYNRNSQLVGSCRTVRIGLTGKVLLIL